jgi:hypothetical protein
MEEQMKRLLLVVLFTPLLVWGQTAFDGTWRLDLSKAQLPKKPDQYLLQNGTYQCESCVPPYTVKADGQDHKVTGHPYFDTVSVRVVNDKSVEFTQKKNGKTVGTDKATVDSTGTHLTDEFTWQPEASSKQQSGKAVSTRVTKGPAGSHAISGSWRGEKIAELSQEAMTWTYKTSANGMSMKAATGESYDAKFDGKDYPYKGDPGTTSVSLKKINANTLEETDKRDGKITSVSRATVSADGKTMKIDIDDKLHGTTASYVAMKQ